MIEAKIIGIMIVLRSVFCGCVVEPKSTGFKRNKGEYNIESLARFPKGFSESSGLAWGQEPDTYFTHTDSGGNNELYKVSPEGKVLDTIIVEGAKNVDWEDLARDNVGNVYIGDFGNNLNRRRDLRIYKFNPETLDLEVINFKFEDQADFPPEKKDRNFDAEGFFWKDGQLHLFSKNRGIKCVKHYIIPDSAGDYNVSPVQSLFLNGMITGADISPDGQLMALLAYGKIYLFQTKEKEGIFNRPYKCLSFTKGGQAEALVFINNTDFLITNETGRIFLGWKRK